MYQITFHKKKKEETKQFLFFPPSEESLLGKPQELTSDLMFPLLTLSPLQQAKVSQQASPAQAAALYSASSEIGEAGVTPHG